MYVRDRVVQLNNSASCLNNNLSVLVTKSNTIFAVVNRTSVMLYIIAPDGKTLNQRQVSCKDPHASPGVLAVVTQAKLVRCGGRDLLVITSTRGMLIYDADGSAMIHWHPLRTDKAGDENSAESKLFRGIAVVGNNILCIGNHSGQIYLFNVTATPSGIQVALTAQMDGHNHAITCMDSRGEWLASGDEIGGIRLWQLMGDKLVSKGTINEAAEVKNCWPVNALRLTPNCGAVVAGYGSGLLRVFDLRTGKMQVEATAHGRMITAVDLADENVVTVSEDTVCRFWNLSRQPDGSYSLQHLHSESMTDQLLIGCHFINNDRIGVSAFESSEIVLMKRQ